MDFINLTVTGITMEPLNDLPQVEKFIGMLDLKTGSMIISALCVVHPMVYGCTIFMPMSYLLLTIWLLLAVFSATSVVLFWGLTKNDTTLITVWIWYSLVFVVIMFLMMLLLALFFASRKQRAKIFFAMLGILWYILTVYFILVVNSHRKEIEAAGIIKSPDDPESPDAP